MILSLPYVTLQSHPFLKRNPFRFKPIVLYILTMTHFILSAPTSFILFFNSSIEISPAHHVKPSLFHYFLR